MRLRTLAILVDPSAADALVERPSPMSAPTAFRIWRAGENVADDGSVFFTKESGERLMAEQSSRARPYSIDFDHLSLASDRPAEAGRAAGWHRLELRADDRDEPELWAVDVEWCADVRAGLEEDPPRWRFFSPAFLVDEDAQVTSYVNLALCINPMTHGIPLLASSAAQQRKAAMNKKAMLAALAAMAEGADGDKKEALQAALSFLSSDEEKDDEKKEAEDDDDKDKDEEKKEAAEDDDKDKEKTESKAHATKDEPPSHAAAAMAEENVELRQRIDRLEINTLIDKRKDLRAVRAWCLTEEPAVVRRFLGKVDKVHAVKRPEKPTQGGGGPAMLEGRDREELDAGMGLRRTTARGPERRDDGTFLLHTVRPTDFRANAQKGQA